MPNDILLFPIAAVIFTILDAAWLMASAKRLYRAELGGLLLEAPRLHYAVAFYVLFLIALVHFVINPAVAVGSPIRALTEGALFGLTAYATYDLTNLATLKGFTLRIAAIDLIWGTLLSATVSAATVLAAKVLGIS
jgi:uncharacterized membrane protein